LFGLYIRRHGTVWAWGRNDGGRLGDGTTALRTTPVQVRNLTNITSIHTGANHSFALDAQGMVWAWGLNGNSRLGNTTTINHTAPTPITDAANIAGISGGHAHTILQVTTGEVWGWGLNDSGQLGAYAPFTSPQHVHVTTLRANASNNNERTNPSSSQATHGSDAPEENTNPFRFAGEYWDWERGEYYLRARSFNPRTGRFTQPDPFFHALNGNLHSCMMQAGNLYMFVMHNPVMWSDHWGLFASNDNGRYVLLEYIMEKYNLANPDSNFSFYTTRSWWNGFQLHLTIGSTTRSFSIYTGGSNVTSLALMISDMIVFDSSVLINTFGLSSEMAIHQVGDIFSSTSNAALAWALTHWKASNNAGVEFASNIYRYNGRYFFGTHISGTARSVGIPELTSGNTRAALVHTHPRQGFWMNILYNIPPGQLNHIGSSDRRVSRVYNVPVYVVGPTQVRRYRANRGYSNTGRIIFRSRLWQL